MTEPPKLEAVAEQIAAWATTKPAIKLIWLYGSRVAGRNWKDGGPPRTDSDLDVAIEIDPSFLEANCPDEEDDENREWAFGLEHNQTWKSELSRISPWEIHLECLWQHATHVACYVRRTGRIIYEADSR
jgi:predicted nucleotidyltransferase